MDHTYTIPEAIERLRVSRNTLYDEIAAGRLRTYRIGRRRYVSAEALQDYIRGREAESQDNTLHRGRTSVR